MTPDSEAHPTSGKSSGPFTIALLYVMLGGAWVTVSNLPWTPPTGGGIPRHVLAEAALVVLTAAALYWLLHRKAQAADRIGQLLRENEARFQAATDGAFTGVYVIQDGRFCYVNPALAEMLGCQPEDLIGKGDPLDFVQAADRVRVEEMLQKQLAGEVEQSRCSLRLLRRDGQWLCCEMMSRRIEYQGRTALAGSLLDVTEHQRDHDQLYASQERLRLVLDHIPQRVFWKDRESRFLGCNEQFARDAGLEFPADIAGKDDGQMPWKEDADRYRSDDRQVMESNTPKLNYEEPQSRPDGSKQWLRTSKIPLHDPEGKVIGMLGTYEDVTERKRQEEELLRLATAVQQTDEAILITNARGDIVYVNPAFEKVTGFSRQEAIGRNPRMLKSGKHSAVFYKQMWETIARGDVWKGRVINKRKDGALCEEDVTISPIRDASGRIVNYLCIKHDVTREVGLEEELRQAHKMEAIGRLAGGVAHDFNNMLTAILGYSDLLLAEMRADDPLGGYVRKIKDASEHSAALTRQLLAFGRKQFLQPRVLNLNRALANMNEMLQRVIGEDIKLQFEPEPTLGWVKVDLAQVHQVVMNLAANARDAMPGGGTLTIRTANTTLETDQGQGLADFKPGPYVMLSVSDTGAGMEPDTLKHLFEPFFTTKRQGQGAGLGLATVYGIVRQSGGQIRVASQIGKGTVFKIYLPRIEAASPGEETSPAEDLTRRGWETILLAEDESGVRDLAQEILQRHGYTVLAAKDGYEAVQIAERCKEPIGLLLTDVVMPGMNGPALAQVMISLHPETKVLYVSGYTDADAVQRSGVGADVQFLPKPFTPHTLALKVREILTGP